MVPQPPWEGAHTRSQGTRSREAHGSKEGSPEGPQLSRRRQTPPAELGFHLREITTANCSKPVPPGPPNCASTAGLGGDLTLPLLHCCTEISPTEYPAGHTPCRAQSSSEDCAHQPLLETSALSRAPEDARTLCPGEFPISPSSGRRCFRARALLLHSLINKSSFCSAAPNPVSSYRQERLRAEGPTCGPPTSPLGLSDKTISEMK